MTSVEKRALEILHHLAACSQHTTNWWGNTYKLLSGCGLTSEHRVRGVCAALNVWLASSIKARCHITGAAALYLLRCVKDLPRSGWPYDLSGTQRSAYLTPDWMPPAHSQSRQLWLIEQLMERIDGDTEAVAARAAAREWLFSRGGRLVRCGSGGYRHWEFRRIPPMPWHQFSPTAATWPTRYEAWSWLSQMLADIRNYLRVLDEAREAVEIIPQPT